MSTICGDQDILAINPRQESHCFTLGEHNREALMRDVIVSRVGFVTERDSGSLGVGISIKLETRTGTESQTRNRGRRLVNEEGSRIILYRAKVMSGNF